VNRTGTARLHVCRRIGRFCIRRKRDWQQSRRSLAASFNRPFSKGRCHLNTWFASLHVSRNFRYTRPPAETSTARSSTSPQQNAASSRAVRCSHPSGSIIQSCSSNRPPNRLRGTSHGLLNNYPHPPDL
jgi:hypothetical protein